MKDRNGNCEEESIVRIIVRCCGRPILAQLWGGKA